MVRNEKVLGRMRKAKVILYTIKIRRYPDNVMRERNMCSHNIMQGKIQEKESKEEVAFSG